jgi:hypothetical protein
MLTRFRNISITLTSMLAIHATAAGPTTQAIALLRWYAANQTTTFAVGANPYGVAFDGSSIWVANGIGFSVTKLQASDGTTLGSFSVNSPLGLAFDGANIWVTNNGQGTVTKLRASDGKNLGSFAVGSGPIAVAFDGANIWVANFDDNSVTKLRASDGTNLGTFAVGTVPYSLAFDGSNIWVHWCPN